MSPIKDYLAWANKATSEGIGSREIHDNHRLPKFRTMLPETIKSVVEQSALTQGIASLEYFIIEAPQRMRRRKSSPATATSR